MRFKMRDGSTIEIPDWHEDFVAFAGHLSLPIGKDVLKRQCGNFETCDAFVASRVRLLGLKGAIRPEYVAIELYHQGARHRYAASDLCHPDGSPVPVAELPKLKALLWRPDDVLRVELTHTWDGLVAGNARLWRVVVHFAGMRKDKT